jgi:type I restriction-modification system DNA methylase subunit
LQKSLISNPPYNMRWKHPALMHMMPQYLGWQEPPESNANFAFILAALPKITGKAVFLLPCGVLSTNNANERAIRKALIDDNLISAVLTLPDQMFESTSIPTCILVIEKERKTRKIEMIDMRNTFESEIRDQNGQFGGASHEGRTYHKKVKVFTEKQINQAVNAVNDLISEEGYCKAAV